MKREQTYANEHRKQVKIGSPAKTLQDRKDTMLNALNWNQNLFFVVELSLAQARRDELRSLAALQGSRRRMTVKSFVSGTQKKLVGRV